MSYCILLLPSVHDVMKAEKILLKAGCSLHVIATPREISHNCGVVIKFDCNELTKIVNLLKEMPVEKKIYQKINNETGYKEIIQV